MHGPDEQLLEGLPPAPLLVLGYLQERVEPTENRNKNRKLKVTGEKPPSEKLG